MALLGDRTIESMRLEKSFLHWKADLLTEFDPCEAGLERFVDLNKLAFVGRDALMERVQRGPVRKRVTLELSCDHAPAQPGASVRGKDKAVIGTVTSAAWGHRNGQNLTLAYVDAGQARVGTPITVDVIGVPIDGSIIADCPYDPEHQRMRHDLVAEQADEKSQLASRG